MQKQTLTGPRVLWNILLLERSILQVGSIEVGVNLTLTPASANQYASSNITFSAMKRWHADVRPTPLGAQSPWSSQHQWGLFLVPCHNLHFTQQPFNLASSLLWITFSKDNRRAVDMPWKPTWNMVGENCILKNMIKKIGNRWKCSCCYLGICSLFT